MTEHKKGWSYEQIQAAAQQVVIYRPENRRRPVPKLRQSCRGMGGEPATTIRHDIWQTVFKSLRTLQRLNIEYQPPGQSPTLRQLDPYHAIRYDGDWYVIGHCHLRDTIRTFSLSRINQAALLEEVFVIPETFDFHQITRSRFGVHWGKAEEQVKIRFSAKVAPYILERTWHPSQKIAYNGDQSLVLSLTVNHMLELKRWVLSWGKEAMVLEPEKLAAEIRAEVGGMAVQAAVEYCQC